MGRMGGRWRAGEAWVVLILHQLFLQQVCLTPWCLPGVWCLVPGVWCHGGGHEKHFLVACGLEVAGWPGDSNQPELAGNTSLVCHI